MSALVGGRYRLLQALGSGGGGDVWLVADEAAQNARCVLKRAALALADRLAAEYELLAGMHHPNLATALDFGVDAQGAFLVTAWVEGVAPIAALPSQAAALTAQALRALAFLHSRGALHLDLKPANVLVHDGVLVLLDLGLWAAPGTRAAGLGSPGFAAPELLRGDVIDQRTDVFGAGALLFALVTGRPPFDDADAVALAARGRTATPLVPAESGPLLSLAQRWCAHDPDGRPANAFAALQELAAVSDVEASETPDTARAYLRSPCVVGRDEELAQLSSRLKAPGATWIRAASGLGATRLGVELQRQSRLVGLTFYQVVVRRADEPLGTVAQLLRLAGDVGAGPEDLDAAERRLVAVQRARPFVAFIDDAQLLDESSAHALAEFAQSVNGPSLFFATDGDGGSITSMLAARPHITLLPLSKTAIGEMASSAFPGRAIPSAFVTDLHRWCGGSPALLEAALALLAARGVVRPGACETAALPESLSPELTAGGEGALLATQLSALSADARLLLGALAILRRSRPLEVAARAAGLSAESAQRALKALVNAGLVRVMDVPQITGTLVARAAISELGDAKPLHRALYDDAIRVLQTIGNASHREIADLRADAAHHALEAQLSEARVLAREAAQALAAEGGAAEAIVLLERAEVDDAATHLLLAQLREALGDYAGALTSAASAAALGDVAGAALRTAQIHARRGSPAQAVPALEAALATASDPGPLLAALARALSFGGRADEALARAEAGLAVATGAARSELFAARAYARLSKGDLEGAAADYAHADRAAADGGDGSARAAAVNGLGLVHQRRGETVAAAARYEESLALAEASGDRARVGTEHLNLGTLRQEAGATSGALAHYRDAVIAARRAGDRMLAARAASNEAALLRYVGNLREAAAAASRARLLAKKAGQAPSEVHGFIIEGEVAALEQRWADARERYAQARELAQRLGLQAELAEIECDLAALSTEVRESAIARKTALEAAARALAAGLTTLHARSLYAAAEAELAAPSPDARQAIDWLYSAMAVHAVRERADLLWRLHWALARAYQIANAAAEIAHHARRTLETLTAAAAQLSSSSRQIFLDRPDRARARAAAQLLAGDAPGDARSSRLLALSRRLGSERALSPLLEAIVDAAVELSGAERGFVLVKPEHAGDPPLVRLARNMDKEALKNPKFKVSHSIAERVIASGEAEMTLDAQGDDRYREAVSIHALKLRSVLCVPLRFLGDVLGALYVDNRFRPDAFGEDDRQSIEAFADQAAVALANTKALEEARAARASAEAASAEIARLNGELSARLDAREAELERARVEVEGARLEVQRSAQDGAIVGASPALRQTLAVVQRAAPSGLPVLIIGESGTGKELVARAVHANSRRKEGPFVSVNCAAFPEGLLEDELFGHVRGAFTGADRDREGLFMAANGGTLFLDEIGDMPHAMQAKLLRVLQDGEVRPVGAQHAKKADVRLVCATHRDLPRAIREGKFREDLFYRINGVTVQLPPLRERKEDIPALVERFLGEIPAPGDSRWRVDPEALALLSAYEWPGNVRELQSAVRNAAAFAEGPRLSARAFAHKPELVVARPHGRSAETVSLAQPLSQLTDEAIRRALEKSAGNKARAARMLGIDRKTIYNRLRGGS